jgi:hypothetical protein
MVHGIVNDANDLREVSDGAYTELRKPRQSGVATCKVDAKASTA